MKKKYYLSHQLKRKKNIYIKITFWRLITRIPEDRVKRTPKFKTKINAPSWKTIQNAQAKITPYILIFKIPENNLTLRAKSRKQR